MKHGTASSYTKGCRCDDCRGYNRDMRRHQRKTNKKLQAYEKGYHAALNIAVGRYREEHPDEWQALVVEQVQLAAETQVTD